MLRVYVAGYTKEKEYRKHVMDNYSGNFDLFEPLREIEAKLDNINWQEYRLGLVEMDDTNVAKLVESEKYVIRNNCDALVAYMKIYSAGTIMEISTAYEADVPVYIIDPLKKFRHDIWLRYHTNIFFDSIDQCFEFLL